MQEQMRFEMNEYVLISAPDPAPAEVCKACNDALSAKLAEVHKRVTESAQR